jgi:AraC-like DNA-binding protein
MNHKNKLIETISGSALYHDFERAFTETTGLPVALLPLESWQLPFRGQEKENHFCAFMGDKSRACAACLQSQQKLTEKAACGPASVTCAVGMTDSAVPVRLGDQLLGFLQTGQVFCQQPSMAQFDRTAKQVAEWGVQADIHVLRQAFFSTRIVPSDQMDASVRLLNIFAQHLALVSNQIVVHQANAEPAMITRAKAFIREHQGEELSLGQVAQAAHASTFYFCKMFKKVTGANFTDYVSRVRIEKAKNLLLNRNLRVSEIAFEVGFQSLTHFNRIFKKVVGQSPTQYKGQLPRT